MSEVELNDRDLQLISIEEEMKSSYLDYAMSVIVSRAIPDVRDGLKPVHRRILYAMYESGYHANRAHKKSARIVGDTIGKYHPHGEGSVYDALVRLAQDFSLKLPLIDGQGNFGSMDGDSAASMRYTEARLAKVSHYLLEDLDKATVDFMQNYDGSEEEPTVLPAMFPNLLVNGTGGIAVGMATNIPPHNLGEVIDACIAYVNNPEIEIEEFFQYMQGPDFPTGAMILGTEGIRSAYLTGRGSILIRARTHIENTSANRQAIIVTEMPYMVNKARLVEKIAELVRDKKIEGISDLRDESNKEGVRVVIEVKKDNVAEVILNQLYLYTQLQTSFGVIMLALIDGMPKVMNLKEVIAAFINFREIVITKRIIFQLNKARDRSHILIGLRIAVSNIDEIIRIIKSAKDPAFAKVQLMEKSWDASDILALVKLVDDRVKFTDDNRCLLSEVQAKAILEMRLQRLTAMEKNKLEDDLQSLKQEIEGYVEILGSREKLLDILKEELIIVKELFSTPRYTTIEAGEFDHNIESLIQREEMVVTVTLGGYIKRVPLVTYRAQKRGGKGRSGLAMREEDVTTQVFVGSTHTPLLFFSNLGQVYSLKLYKLPIGTPQTKGRPLVNILSLKDKEYITNIMPMPEDDGEWDKLNLMFCTALGNVRRNDLSDFKKIQVNGKIAIRLDEGDNLINVKVCSENDHILLASQLGKAIRFEVSEVRVFKSRTSDGVRGMKLAKDDKVISMTVLKGIKVEREERDEYLSISKEDRNKIINGEIIDLTTLGIEKLSVEKIKLMVESEDFILTVTEKGFGKRSSAYNYRITARGGSGIINFDLSPKTGLVIAALPVAITDELMLITDGGKLIRCKLATVRITGRNTSGVILFKTEESEKVVSVALIADTAVDEVIDAENVEESMLDETIENNDNEPSN